MDEKLGTKKLFLWSNVHDRGNSMIYISYHLVLITKQTVKTIDDIQIYSCVIADCEGGYIT